jgi:CTP:molybdopterin cytidylyltransferase MocA
VFVLLAGGGGTRFAGATHKLQALLGDGRTVGDHALAAVLDASDAVPDTAVVVVSGAVALDVPDRVTQVRNERWSEGQATSLRAGLDAADRLGASAVVVGLADQPFVGRDPWVALATSPDGAPILVATYGGRRGNPVRLDRSIWPLLPDTGDEGARTLMRIRPDLVGEVPCTGSPADIDTVEDLLRWQSN